MPKPRPTCAYCGKDYGQRDVRSMPLKWACDEPKPAYTGNHIHIRDRFERKNQEFEMEPSPVLQGYMVPKKPLKLVKEYMTCDRETWDGETYFTRYDPFCTLRCALAYARNAYNTNRIRNRTYA